MAEPRPEPGTPPPPGASPGAPRPAGGQYHLATLFPVFAGLRLPVSRDQAMLLMAATNEIFLGVDIFFAHQISGSIVGAEWIPIVFGPIAGMLLLAAGLLARRRRDIATVFANVVFAASIIVGLLGAFFHLRYALLPSAPAGSRVTVDLLVWAPPLLGPLTFCLVGLIGLSAAWLEDPPDSGVLVLLRGRRLRLPYSKTQAYLFMVGMGSLATVLSSVLDHARTGFHDPRLWLPTAVGVFATVVSVALGALDRPTRRDLRVYLVAMLLMIAVGLGGAWLHIHTDLGTTGSVVLERFIRGAPFMAPLLFADIGAIGLLALMAPTEGVSHEGTKNGGGSHEGTKDTENSGGSHEGTKDTKNGEGSHEGTKDTKNSGGSHEGTKDTKEIPNV